MHPSSCISYSLRTSSSSLPSNSLLTSAFSASRRSCFDDFYFFAKPKRFQLQKGSDSRKGCEISEPVLIVIERGRAWVTARSRWGRARITKSRFIFEKFIINQSAGVVADLGRQEEFERAHGFHLEFNNKRRVWTEADLDDVAQCVSLVKKVEVAECERERNRLLGLSAECWCLSSLDYDTALSDFTFDLELEEAASNLKSHCLRELVKFAAESSKFRRVHCHLVGVVRLGDAERLRVERDQVERKLSRACLFI